MILFLISFKKSSTNALFPGYLNFIINLSKVVSLIDNKFPNFAHIGKEVRAEENDTLNDPDYSLSPIMKAGAYLVLIRFLML